MNQQRYSEFQKYLSEVGKISKSLLEIEQFMIVNEKVDHCEELTDEEQDVHTEMFHYLDRFQQLVQSRKRKHTSNNSSTIFCTPLYKFLNERRSPKGSKMTHYGMPGPLMGRYLISAEDEPKLMEHYQSTITENRIAINLGECHKEYGPVVIDLDFKYSLSESNSRRGYNLVFVKHLIAKYYAQFELLLMLDGIHNKQQCIVLEKRQPTIDADNTCKDGLHIQFPNIITTPLLQKIIRKNVLLDPTIRDIANDLRLTNTLEDVIDEAVIEKNGWLLYGSRKYKKNSAGEWQVSSEPYRIDVENGCSGVYEVSSYVPNITKLDIATNDLDLFRLLSIRQSVLGDLIELSVEGNNAVAFETKNQHLRITQKASLLFPNSSKSVHLYKDDIQYVIGLVQLLNPERAQTYFSWIYVGWCLFNIDCRLLNTWVEFSKQDERYKNTCQEVCNEEWNKMFLAESRDELNKCGIGTLTMMAKEDNPVQFKTHLCHSIWYKIKVCCDKYIRVVTETDKDGNKELKHKRGNYEDICYYIAEIVKHYFSHIMICTSFDKKSWMIFRNDRWFSSDKGVELRYLIDEELFSVFSFWEMEFRQQSRSINPNEDKLGQFRKDGYAKACYDFATFLRNPRKKILLIDVCAEKMFWGRTKPITDNVQFEEQLDSNKELIGFNNGIYDLKNGLFRCGRPEDYVSLTTRNNYVEYSWTDPYVVQISEFLCQVFPIERVRVYACKLLASFIDGHLLEKFYIWTGIGGNGKSKLIELFQLSMGNYCGVLPVTLITGKRQSSSGATPELARMKGKRLGIMNESNHNDSIDMGLIKSISGGDTMYARALHKDPIEFRPTFQMLLLCNKKPKRIDSTDFGAWRRITILRFPSRFVERPDPNNLFEFLIDTHLDEKLITWRQAFFWMLTQYYKDWKRDGNEEPEEVRMETEQYRENNNIIGQFIKECTQQTSSGYLLVSQMFNAFLEHQKNQKNERSKMSFLEFEEHMLFELGDYSAPNNIKGWNGMKFNSDIVFARQEY